MRKNRLFLLAALSFLVSSYLGVAQSSSEVAVEAVMQGLEVDTTEIEIYGTNLSLNEEENDTASKVLVDHHIVYEVIRPTSNKKFFIYKRLDKIVYLMPTPILQSVMKLEESMADN